MILVISSAYIIYYNIEYLKSQEVHQIQNQNANAVEDISNRIIKDKREYLNNPYLRTKNKLAIYSLQAGKSAYTLVRKLFVLKNKLK